MPEKNEEMSLRDALMTAMSADPSAEQNTETAEGAASEQVPVENLESTESTSGQTVQMSDTPADSINTATDSVPMTPQNIQNTQNIPSMTEMWQAFQSLIAENQQLRNAMNQQNAAMQQQSDAAESAILNQFTPSAAAPAQTQEEITAPPSLNFAEISYMSPQEQQEYIAKWQQDMTNYAVQTAAAQLREEFAPVRDDYEAKKRIAANEAARSTLFSMPQFSDMKGKEGDIEKIIEVTPLLKNADPESKYMLAALISRGIHASNGPTTEDLIEMATSNPDVMKAIETRRMSEIQKNNDSLPKVIPSSGIGNANAVPENKPQTMDDVKNALLKKFRL